MNGRWQLGVYTSQITAVVIDYFCIIYECTLTIDLEDEDDHKERKNIGSDVSLVFYVFFQSPPGERGIC